MIPQLNYLMGEQNAWDMLNDEKSLIHLTTSSADLNNILGGGIHCKEVTEIGGVPDIGKTQLGWGLLLVIKVFLHFTLDLFCSKSVPIDWIQIPVNVQIRHDFDGLSGKAIYISNFHKTTASFCTGLPLDLCC
ncbi:DNA repair protein RAD51 homolog 3-like [Durio zibethinus]|uniref:DNA repair protein RAD51 homolog 3-like n=1 Tax=Durio zibethinus TaxID=66656 RepID=A0A6P6AZH6_DURZI|nr:DNA repair protein RAD51 homolog 3-like [Durio zibethinus]